VKFRVGIGFDIHLLQEGGSLVIGGVPIPFEKGLVGHSDGDVLLHAIIDALLGACGQGNIGEKFPDTDSRFSGVASTELLKNTADIIRQSGYKISNIDSNILAERPKLLSYFRSMKEEIAEVLEISEDLVHIKAKTMEQLGAIGSEQAMAAQAVALVFID